ncbi:MAG: inorganic phosphate transporter [bacterium]
MAFVFLSSGLFLGWSLGANDAANIFGGAVSSKMIRFKTAAVICGGFVILGAVVSGAGTTQTLGALGSVNAIAGAFMVALSAGATVFWMSKLKVPVSTSQAIVGAIVGWNFYASALTDFRLLGKIVSTWVLCPLLACLLSIVLFAIFRTVFNRARIHLLRVDSMLRSSLVLVGAFGAYSLGANNIANVMGVFVPVSPFGPLHLAGFLTLTSAQLLYFVGGVAIAAGVYTYSDKVMKTVGSGIFRLSPEAALVVVLANALVLFLFSSLTLERWLLTAGLPPIPLVPVSSTQAVVGAVLGIGILKGARDINFGVLGEIAAGWITTPVIAGVMAFIALFFLENVFNQQVSQRRVFYLDEEGVAFLRRNGIEEDALHELRDQKFDTPMAVQSALKGHRLSHRELRRIVRASEVVDLYVAPEILRNNKMNRAWFTAEQLKALEAVTGHSFKYRWQLSEKLSEISSAWRLQGNSKLNRVRNKEIRAKLDYLIRISKKPLTL